MGGPTCTIKLDLPMRTGKKKLHTSTLKDAVGRDIEKL